MGVSTLLAVSVPFGLLRSTARSMRGTVVCITIIQM